MSQELELELEVEPEKEQENKPPSSRVVSLFTLPSFIDPAAWAGYEEMRKKKRSPLTSRAKQLAIDLLSTWASTGHDANAILDNSTMNGWTGLFLLKEGGINGAFDGKDCRNASKGAAAITQIENRRVTD